MEQKNNLNENNSLQNSSLSQSNLLASMFSDEELEDLINCPVSHEIMFDPVFLPSGHAMEREVAIDAIKKKPENPLTRESMNANQLISDLGKKMLIGKILKNNPKLWEEVYESPAHREKVIATFSGGKAGELFDLLSKDPRVIYEKLKIANVETTLLEHAVTNKKYFSCFPKIIHHASTNPLGGVEQLKEIVDQNSIFNNLVGQQAIVEIKLIAEAFLWGKKEYESFCLNALHHENFLVLAFFCSKDAPVVLQELRPEGRSLLYHAVINNSPTDVLKKFITELPEPILAEDLLCLADLKSIDNEPPLNKGLPGLQSLRLALTLLGVDIKLFNYCALNHRDKIPLIAKLLDWQQDFFQEAARFIPADLQAPAILQIAIAHGVDPNYVYKERNESLLCYYALNSSIFLVQELLKIEDLQVNAKREDNGQTVLHQCVILGESPEVVNVLLESHKCDLWIKDSSNKIPLDYGFSNPKILAVLIHYYHPKESFRYLVENYTQDPRFKEYFKAAGFSQKLLLERIKDCIAGKDIATLSACMSLVTDLNSIANDQELITAVLSSDDTKCLEVVCQYDIFLQTRINGNTLVHEAIRLGSVDAVFFFLDKGVALEGDDAKNTKGQKPEEYAKELGLNDLAGQIKNKRKKLKLEKQQGHLIKKIQDLTAQLSVKEDQLSRLNEVVAPLQKNKHRFTELMQMFPFKGAVSKKVGENLSPITGILEISPNCLITSAGINLCMWDLDQKNNSPLKNGRIFSGQISHFALFAKIETFVTADDRGSVHVWDFSKRDNIKIVKSYDVEGKVVNLTKLSDNQIGCIFEEKQSTRGATSSGFCILSLNQDKPVKKSLDNLKTAAVFFTKDNKHYLAIGRKGLYFAKSYSTIIIYQINDDCTLGEVAKFDAHDSDVTNLVYINSGKLVSTSSMEIKLWDINNIDKPIEKCSRSIKDTVKQVLYFENNYLALVMNKKIAVYQAEDLQHIYNYESDHSITAICQLSDHKLGYAQSMAPTQENNNLIKYELCTLTHPSFLKTNQIFKEVEEDVVSVCNQM